MRKYAIAFALCLAACGTTPTVRDMPTARDYPPILINGMRKVDTTADQVERYRCARGMIHVERLTLVYVTVQCL